MKALLLTPDLKHKEVTMRDYRDIRTLVGGSIEMIPMREGDIVFGDYILVGYVNESGVLMNLQYSEWGPILDEMGFYINHLYGLRGNVVLLLSDELGNDISITKNVVSALIKVKEQNSVWIQ